MSVFAPPPVLTYTRHVVASTLEYEKPAWPARADPTAYPAGLRGTRTSYVPTSTRRAEIVPPPQVNLASNRARRARELIGEASADRVRVQRDDSLDRAGLAPLLSDGLRREAGPAECDEEGDHGNDERR
jgi:hypothetical protein